MAPGTKNPLAHLVGNRPWTASPEVNGISSDVPENCYVDQAAYVLRHGSRYPDSSAYSSWVDMARRVGRDIVPGVKPGFFG
ncbi:hypothetical protein VTK56DRAFT_2102 [Thermocarpiscus australiensis]